MSRDDARDLYGAMLDGRVSDLEMGGVMLALRFKGESVEEIAGFLEAAENSFDLLPAPPGDYAPVLIPSYNGARKMANLTPLLAMLLAREGVPVLVHGVTRDPGRVTTAEIFEAMGLPAATCLADTQVAHALGHPSFMPIETLAPKLAHLLSLRRILGVRNSTHTLVKILQPYQGPALRLVSYTHPEYLEMLGEYFTTAAPARARRRVPDARHRRRDGGQRQPRPADRLVSWRRTHHFGAARCADGRFGAGAARS